MKEVRKMTAEVDVKSSELLDSWKNDMGYPNAVVVKVKTGVVPTWYGIALDGGNAPDGVLMQCEHCKDVVLAIAGNIYDSDTCQTCGR